MNETQFADCRTYGFSVIYCFYQINHPSIAPKQWMFAFRDFPYFRSVCPEAKAITGPCVPDSDGRSYRLIHIHRWFRQGCECKSMTPTLKQRVLCACRPPRGLERCSSPRPGMPRNQLEVSVIREQLVSRTKRPGTETETVCLPMPPIEQRRTISKCQFR